MISLIACLGYGLGIDPLFYKEVFPGSAVSGVKGVGFEVVGCKANITGQEAPPDEEPATPHFLMSPDSG